MHAFKCVDNILNKLTSITTVTRVREVIALTLMYMQNLFNFIIIIN